MLYKVIMIRVNLKLLEFTHPFMLFLHPYHWDGVVHAITTLITQTSRTLQKTCPKSARDHQPISNKLCVRRVRLLNSVIVQLGCMPVLSYGLTCAGTRWTVQSFFSLRLWITLPGNSNRITKSQDNFWSFNQTRNYLSCVLRLPVYLCLHWSYHGNLTSWWSKSRGCELEMQPRFGKMELKLEVIPLFCAAVALASLVSRPVEAQQGDDANVFNPRGKPQIPSLSFI